MIRTVIFGSAFTAFALASLAAHSAAPAGADPGAVASGRAVFAQCAGCHGGDGGGSDLGPDLHKIVGRKAASAPDFAYSGALRRSGKVWTPAALAAFLANPQAVVPGTRMAFGGLKDPRQQTAVVAYLGTLN